MDPGVQTMLLFLVGLAVFAVGAFIVTRLGGRARQD